MFNIKVLQTMKLKVKLTVLAVAIIVNVILFKVCFLHGSTITELPDDYGRSTKLIDDAGLSPISFNNSYFKTGVGYCDIGQVLMDCNVPTWEELEKRFTMLQPGGWYKPPTQPTDRIVIVIPYRDREEHLKLFLQHMHPFLQKQHLEYRIVVVELEKGVIFKKGLLMNIGFIETSKTSDIHCYAFHDIDMLPLNSRILYTCTKDNVYHPTRFIKQYRFRDFISGPYSGGVLVFHKKSFKKVNGFSNLYWGWGGEDDDMTSRLNSVKIPIKHPNSNELRYMTWNHGREKIFENRLEFVMKAVERMNTDGLNSAEYRILKVEKKPLYTRILVSANQGDGSYKNLWPRHVGWEKFNRA